MQSELLHDNVLKKYFLWSPVQMIELPRAGVQCAIMRKKKRRAGGPPQYKRVTAEQVSAAAAVELAVMPGVLRRRYFLR